MKEKTLEELKAERQVLADKLLGAMEKGPNEYHKVCMETARHFLTSLQLVMNPIPSPVVFLAVFALQRFAKIIASNNSSAQEMADNFAETVEEVSTIIEMPRIRRKEEDKE